MSVVQNLCCTSRVCRCSKLILKEPGYPFDSHPYVTLCACHVAWWWFHIYNALVMLLSIEMCTGLFHSDSD